MPSFLIFIIILIFVGVWMSFQADANKKGKRVNWVHVVLAFLPFGLFFGILLLVALHGRQVFNNRIINYYF